MVGARTFPGARYIFASLIVAAAFCATATGATIYVDAGATGASTGTSWQHALDSLQDALLLAYFAEKPVEIRVARGVYRPDQGLGITPGDRTASFELMNGVTIKGGYIGGRASDARDPRARETVLSGNIGAQDRSDDNSHHVATGSGTDATAVLEGCVITAANGDNGGGMVNDNGGPTIVDCVFRNNQAVNGAGMYNVNGSRPVLNRCTFHENVARDSGGAIVNNASVSTLTNCTFRGNSADLGGAMFNGAGSTPALTSCTFVANSAATGGGALYNDQSSLTLVDCTLEENSSRDDGGALHNTTSNVVLLACTFHGNSAEGNGGAIARRSSGEMTVRNCLFSGNAAERGSAVDNYTGGPATLTNCTFTRNAAATGETLRTLGIPDLVVSNCIVWGNVTGTSEGLPMVAEYSNIEGSSSGQNNISVDPLFADPNGDYHLKSQAGRWDPAAGHWVVDSVSSPCIDAGDPASGTNFEPSPNGSLINMGAHGGTFEASLSPTSLARVTTKASNPFPPDGAVGVSSNIELSWTAGSGAVRHDVYLGIDFEPVAQGSRDDLRMGVLVSENQSATSYDPALLSLSRTYWWRVDEIGSDGSIVKGDVWRFTTEGGPVKGRACFTPETPVWADGALVPISQVRPAQDVSAICGDIAEGRMIIRPYDSFGAVELIQEHDGAFVCYDVLLATGNAISVVSGHYFMTDDGRWMALQSLRADMSLRTATGSVTIAAVHRRPRPYVGKVYNLKIADSDCYLVGKDALVVRDY
ncbi:MAG: hypothetical protein JW993_02995 [Sedimentisphaerales bacterium]|nr:hypothetical protein [Sedimentisphaerales bacterium]